MVWWRLAMLSGFRDFILRGNVVELAVAVVIGAAFGAVITSFTKDILTPMLGLLGVPDFSHLTWTTPGGAVVAYGTFLNALIACLLVAAAIYFFVITPPVPRARNAEPPPRDEKSPGGASAGRCNAGQGGADRAHPRSPGG